MNKVAFREGEGFVTVTTSGEPLPAIFTDGFKQYDHNAVATFLQTRFAAALPGVSDSDAILDGGGNHLVLGGGSKPFRDGATCPAMKGE